MSANRKPAVAGRFYPAGEQEVLCMLKDMVRPVNFSGRAVGAVVPHAGWVFSGATAALGISAIAAEEPRTIVIFGAVHTLDTNAASLYASGSWETPLGLMPVDEELARLLIECPYIEDNPAGHRSEHSIEVQLPLIQYIVGDVKICPISVRPGPHAAEIGRFVAIKAREIGRRICFLSSTDLTHYGPHFGFEPHGHGRAGVNWAKKVNDRRFVELIKGMNDVAVISEAATNHNSCGAGAVAAGISAAREMGANHYHELEHTISADYEARFGVGEVTTSVGYESGVFTVQN